MISIERALYEYLIDPADGDQSQPERNTARQTLLSKLGKRISLNRRPQHALDPSLEIRRVSVLPFNDLPGEPACTVSLLDLVMYAKEDGMLPNDLIELTMGPLHQAVAQYRGTMGGLYIHSTALERAMQQPAYLPIDASDNWTFNYTLTLEIMHEQQAIKAIA